MHCHLLVHGYEEPVPARVEPRDASLLTKAATEAPPPANKVHHGEALVAANGEGKLAGGVEAEVIDGAAVDVGEGLEVDEAVGVEEGKGAVGVSGEEVAG